MKNRTEPTFCPVLFITGSTFLNFTDYPTPVIVNLKNRI